MACAEEPPPRPRAAPPNFSWRASTTLPSIDCTAAPESGDPSTRCISSIGRSSAMEGARGKGRAVEGRFDCESNFRMPRQPPSWVLVGLCLGVIRGARAHAIMAFPTPRTGVRRRPLAPQHPAPPPLPLCLTALPLCPEASLRLTMGGARRWAMPPGRSWTPRSTSTTRAAPRWALGTRGCARRPLG